MRTNGKKAKAEAGAKALAWTNIRVRLGDLKPWADNPRASSKAQAQRLLDSWREFGQVETVAVGPKLEVYDGHQRLSALMTLYGPEHEIDARQASRALTDDERRRLVVLLHAGATGAWDWDALSGWDASLSPQLKWVVSFADGAQCGDGAIYRASGFVLTGIRVNNSIWSIDLDGQAGARESRTSLTDPTSTKQKMAGQV